jgi:hypothetical protein
VKKTVNAVASIGSTAPPERVEPGFVTELKLNYKVGSRPPAPAA